MPRRVAGLTAVQAKTLAPGRYADGDGLYLLVRETGRFWIMRYRFAGRDREIGLGRAGGSGAVSLSQARQASQKHRLTLRAGADPLDEKRAALVAQKAAAMEAEGDAMTFRKVAALYVEGREHIWRNVKHRMQWRSTLDTYAMPEFGDTAVANVTTAEVLQALEPIWSKKPVTASRLRGRIEVVLDYATVKGWRRGENPARWRGHLAQVLPARARGQAIKHHAALPWCDMKPFMEKLAEQRSATARALEWTILTAARTGETIGATWAEINEAAQIWTVPASRMKAGMEHRVPLSSAALKVLANMSLRGGEAGDHIFSSGKLEKPLSNMAMSMLLRRMEYTGVTVHGFRSAFRDWCAEATDTPRDIAEACLAHTIGSKVEAAYRRGDALEKRRAVMDAWAAFCLGAVPA